MSKASTHTSELGRSGSSGPVFDKFVFLPILACVYVEIIAPLLLRADTGPMVAGGWNRAQSEIIFAPRLEPRILWPAMAAISAVWALRNWSRLTLPPHIISLFAYLALAGASVLWAYKPEVSSIRFAQQAMIITSVVLPALLAVRTADMMRGVFLCFAFALITNLSFTLVQAPMILGTRICYPGYFTHKSALGECAAISLLLSLHEILYPGWRRVSGVIVMGIAIYLAVISDSKGSLAFALLAPLLAGLTLFIGRITRASPAIILLPIPIFFTVLSYMISNLVSRISWHLYGNYDLSGRTLIWDFANFEIARRPFLGWGYQSFWLAGPDAPSIVDAPGWVKEMPNSHSGYLDTTVDMGYVGYVLLVIFIFATLHAIGRVVSRDPARAWLLLTIALYVIITNFIETGWMHGVDMLWVIFLIVVAEAGRYWQPFRPGVSEPLRPDPVIAGHRPGLARGRGTDKFAGF